jgi:hypothetical protein
MHLECSDLDEYCATILNRSIGLPTSSAPFKTLELVNNSAYAYGNDIATSPYETVALGDNSFDLIPMISLVNVSVLLRDTFGQIVKGTSDIPIPYILELWTCSSARCRVQHSLSPLIFLPFDSTSGIADSSTLKQTIPCGTNSSMVTVHFSLYGSSSSLLMESFAVRCLECGASQVRVNEVITNKASIWFCRPCLPGQYIMNQNEDSCQDCPLGKPFMNSFSHRFAFLLVDGLWYHDGCFAEIEYAYRCLTGAVCEKNGSFFPKIPDSVWIATGGIYRLTQCPRGHQLVNSIDGTSKGKFSQVSQRCKPCLPGQYIIDPSTDECQPCPIGA